MKVCYYSKTICKYQHINLCVVHNDTTNRKKSVNRDNANSINIQNVYAVSPMYTHHSWTLGGENIHSSSTSTSNTITSLSACPLSPSQDSVLRGFQLHSYQTLADSVLQEMLIIFQSNQLNQIERWYQLLSKIVSDCMLHKNCYNILTYVLFISSTVTSSFSYVKSICWPKKFSKYIFNQN